MRLPILLAMFFLSGCCVFTSQDCDCDPPDPALDEDVLKWIKPFNNQDFFVFKDSIGNVDSLQTIRTSDTESCGGDECSSNCQVEIATLTSISKPSLNFTMTASFRREIRINTEETIGSQINVTFDALTERTFLGNANTTASIIDDYAWNNEIIKVLKINCENDSNCLDFEMKELVISRNFGLIEYVAKDGIRWKKIN